MRNVEIKYILYIVGVVAVIFFAGFFVRGCTIEKSYIDRNIDYQATIERLKQTIADENDTIQRITTEFQTARKEFEAINNINIENRKRIEKLKETTSDEKTRIDIIRESIRRIEKAVTK